MRVNVAIGAATATGATCADCMAYGAPVTIGTNSLGMGVRIGLGANIRTLGDSSGYSAFHAGRSDYNPNADLDAAAIEHAANLKDWGDRRRSVERQTGYTAAKAAQGRASEVFGDLCDELLYARPVSIAGLRAKAEAARVSANENLQQQIVFDIGVLFGDLDSDEKAVA